MPIFPAPIDKLIEELKKLPGIGPKSAQRIVFHLLKAPAEQVSALSLSLQEMKRSVGRCRRCNYFAVGELCHFCADPNRSHAVVCVVEEPSAILPVEKSGEFKGMYHVLMGSLSPVHGVSAEDLQVDGLLARIREGGVEEVIIATNPTMDGEATALYLYRLIKPHGCRVTRIGMGIPVGGDLEYADEVTLARALVGRRDLS